MAFQHSTTPFTKVELDNLGIVRLHSDLPQVNLEVWDTAFLEAISHADRQKNNCLLDENIISRMDVSSNDYAVQFLNKRKKIMAVVVPNFWKRIKLYWKSIRNKTTNIKYFPNTAQATSWLRSQMQELPSPTLN